MTKKSIVLQDKLIQTGSSPIFDETEQEIGSVHYRFFSLSGKIEIKNVQNEIVSKGKAKLLSLFPKWLIFDHNGNKTGVIKRKLTFWLKKYEYIQQSGKRFTIKGDIWERNFKVLNEVGEEIITVSTLSNIISLRPHTFLIEFDDVHFDSWEAISLIQGVRSLVKREEDARNNTPDV